MSLRLAGMWLSPDSFRDDPDGYAGFAHQLATTGTFGIEAGKASAHRLPMYPVLLAPWCMGEKPIWLGIATIHLAAAAATVIMTWRLAEVCGGRKYAALAALLVAVDPLLLQQSKLIMTETVFTAVFVGLVLSWMKQCEGPDNWARRWKTSGLLALAALIRPIAWAYWIGVMLLGSTGRRREWAWTMAMALTLASPWAGRNYLQFGAPILTTTHGGYTLWLGQNPEFYREEVVVGAKQWPDESFQRWTQENLRQTAGMTEVERDVVYRSMAWQWMRENPGSAVRSIIYHVWSLWRPNPRIGSEKVRWLCGVYYITLYLLAFIGLCQSTTWRVPNTAIPIALLVWTAVHAVYWSNIRMRAPLIPLLAVLAAIGIQRLLEQIGWRRRMVKAIVPG